MDTDVVLNSMQERFEAAANTALAAVREAPDGRWIEASEFAVNDAFNQLKAEFFQAALQARADAQPAAAAGSFSPGQPCARGR